MAKKSKNRRYVHPKKLIELVANMRKRGSQYVDIIEVVNERFKTNLNLQQIRGIGYRALGKTGHNYKPPETVVETQDAHDSRDAQDERDLARVAHITEQVIAREIGKLKEKNFSPTYIAEQIKALYNWEVSPQDINQNAPIVKEKKTAPSHVQLNLDWAEENKEYIEVRIRVRVNQAIQLLTSLVRGDL